MVRAKKEEEDEEARQEMWKDWARDDNRPAKDWLGRNRGEGNLPARSCRSRRRARTCGSSG